MTASRARGQQLVVHEQVADRIRRPAPPKCCVLPGSLPVVSFGDPNTALIATLSLNPSSGEFLDPNGHWLSPGKRRLPALAELRDLDPRELSHGQVADVVASCHDYFSVNPLKGFFGNFERLMQRAGIGSYYDGGACHLDLVQWATDPLYGNLSTTAQERLVAEDAPFLSWQLTHQNIRLVLCNGMTVVRSVNAARIAAMEQVGNVYFGNGQLSTIKVYVGQSQGVTFLGWNCFLGGPMPREARAALTAWIGDQVGELDEPPMSSVPPQRSASLVQARVADLGDGYIPLGTTVSSTAQLTELLRNWVSVSSQSTIGDVGDFGKRPWLRVELGMDLVVLNADTKRSAVLDYLAHAADVGHNPPWYVRANRSGRINKVGYRDHAPPSPGWYAYLVPPADGPRTL